MNELTKDLKSAFPDSDFGYSNLARIRATQIRSLVPVDDLPRVLVAYSVALTKVYTVAPFLSALSMIGSLAMEARSAAKLTEDHRG